MARRQFAIVLAAALCVVANVSWAESELASGTAAQPAPPAASSNRLAQADAATPAQGQATTEAQSPGNTGTPSDASARTTPDQAPAPADASASDAQTMPGSESTAPPLPVASPAENTAPADGSKAESAAPQLSAAQQRDLWNRIRKGFGMPDLVSNKAATSTRWYAGQPDYIGRMTTRASLYLYYIVQEIERRGLPTELALLPFVESAMQPQAMSAAQAAGLWQFIPSTGKVYALEQNMWKDERFGVVESTRAALDYLEKLYAEFGNWHLALAAYNYGEAGVERALAYNRSRHRPLTYESLRLPRETQFYVPKLQAIKNIVADPARYGIALPQIQDRPYFVTVSGARDMDVATAAQLADMPLEDFQALNPAYNRPLIVGAMAPTLLLPADRGDKFSANFAAWQSNGQPLASWTAYRLKAGETLGAVALRVGVNESALRTANHVPPRYVLASGSTILIPRGDSTDGDVPTDMLDASMALVPEHAGLRKVTVRVRRGDTLATISRRWHVTPDEVMAWNDLRAPTLYAGQRLSLTVGSAPAPHKGPVRKARPHPGTTLARATTPASSIR